MILREQFPDARVTVAAMYPEHEGPLMEIPGLQVVPGYNRTFTVSEDGPPTHKLAFRLTNLLRYMLPYGVVRVLEKKGIGPKIIQKSRPKSEAGFSQVRHLKEIMLNSDAVISIGGDLYIEDYGPPTYFIEVVEYAQLLGRSTIIWGASIWPFKTLWIERRVKDMLLHADLVTVRDDLTLEYLASLGVKDNVVRVADSAFIMAPRSSDRTVLPWTRRPSTVIGFNGSSLLYSFLPGQRAKQVINAIIRFFQVLLDEHDCGVVLIPHDGYPGAAERDFLFGIEQMIDRPGRVYMIPVGLNAPEIKAVIGQCDMFISMRFHPSIASLSQSIPTLGLSHSPKFAGLHKSVYGHTDYLISYDHISLDILMEKFQQLRANQNSIRQQLSKRIPELQAQARLGGKHVRDLLTSNSTGAWS
jgi:polysaccharide pyruvyl transferase WcaK-like protein